MNVDKAKVREDYINGKTVRQLAKDYGVPKSTIGRWVQQYGWVREATKIEKSLKPVIDLDGTSGTERPKRDKKSGTQEPKEIPVNNREDYETLRAYTMKLLGKADQLLELDDALAPRDLKSLSSMLLDVRTLLNILSPREAAEQEIRLQALRMQAQEKEKEQQASDEVVVRFVDTEGAQI